MKGLSLRRIPENLPGAGIPVVWLHYTADPNMTPERVAALRKTYTSDARWKREMEIEYEALEGELVYPEFSRTHHVIPEFEVWDTDFWTIYQACDPHGRTPHAHVWRAINAAGDHICCGEMWQPQHFDSEGRFYRPTTTEYSEVVKWIESDANDKPRSFEWANGHKLHVYDRVMDTHGHAVNAEEGKDIFEKYRECGLFYRNALKGEQRLANARDEIGGLLKPVETMIGNRREMRTRWRVFETCYETIREFERVRYPEGEVERDTEEKPKTYRKHCLDGHHYIQTMRPGFVMPKRGGSRFEPIYGDLAY